MHAEDTNTGEGLYKDRKNTGPYMDAPYKVLVTVAFSVFPARGLFSMLSSNYNCLLDC